MVKKKPAEILRAFQAYKKIAALLRARAIIFDIRLSGSDQFVSVSIRRSVNIVLLNVLAQR
jgi:hypothetical protein